MSHKIIIDSVQNGYYVTEEVDGEVQNKFVIQQKDTYPVTHASDIHDEIKTFSELCYELKEMLGIRREKHSEPEHWFTCGCTCEEEK